MLLNFFNDVLNTLVRNLDMKVRIIISFVFAFLAIYCFVFSIRKKNDKAPLSLGWFILFFLFLGVSVVYVLPI